MMSLLITEPIISENLFKALVSKRIRHYVTPSQWGILLNQLAITRRELIFQMIMEEDEIMSQVPERYLNAFLRKVLISALPDAQVIQKIIKGPLSSHVTAEIWENAIHQYIKSKNYGILTIVVSQEKIMKLFTEDKRLEIYKKASEVIFPSRVFPDTFTEAGKHTQLFKSAGILHQGQEHLSQQSFGSNPHLGRSGFNRQGPFFYNTLTRNALPKPVRLHLPKLPSSTVGSVIRHARILPF